eukprot:13505263-Alexandrium_andersonii.AAC.1
MLHWLIFVVDSILVYCSCGCGGPRAKVHHAQRTFGGTASPRPPALLCRGGHPAGKPPTRSFGAPGAPRGVVGGRQQGVR